METSRWRPWSPYTNNIKRMKNSTKPSRPSRAVLTAAALQDHWTKSLSLQAPVKKSNHTRSSGANLQKTNCRKKKKEAKKTLDQDQEYVLGPKEKPLTLAQKLGLVDAPPVRLTDDEWQQVKSRSNDRKDSAEPCVICKEEYRKQDQGSNQDQVLLSCSHVFHRVCLESFEKFSGGKTCPMCRKEQYETRVIHEGRKLWRHKCAARIQAAWRGYVVRSWYKKFRQTVPPKDPNLRKKFYEEKLHTITDRIVKSVDTIEVDTFLAQIDQSVEDSRRVMRFVGEDSFNLMSDADWRRVENQARDRFSSECPICFTKLCGDHHGTSEDKSSLISQDQRVRRVFLLSCSHVFHKKCLEAFEQLSLNSADICPVCRSPYYKKDL